MEQTEDVRMAFEIYLNSGNYGEALMLIEKHHWMEALPELVSQLRDDQTELLRQCSELSQTFENASLTESILQKLNDKEKLVEVISAFSESVFRI